MTMDLVRADFALIPGEPLFSAAIAASAPAPGTTAVTDTGPSPAPEEIPGSTSRHRSGASPAARCRSLLGSRAVRSRR
jgi:hypothetical protein